MKKLIILILALAIVPTVNAQNCHQLDSLLLSFQQTYQYDSALVYAKKYLHCVKESIGVTDTLYANALTTMVVLNYYSGNYQDAIEYGEQEKAARARIQGKNHPDYASAINNLAILHKSIGNYASAEPLYEEAMELNKNIFGTKHPVFATSLNNLALLYFYMGNYPDAKVLFKQSLSIIEDTNGKNNPEYASTLNNLAMVKNALGEYALAERLYNESLSIRKEVLGDNHPQYAESLNNLAEFYYNLGNYSIAEGLFNDALHIEKEIYGENHPNYAITLNNLASFYEQVDKDEEAKELYLQAIKIIGDFLGANHPTYAILLDNLAYLHGNLKEYKLAEELYLQSMDINKEVLGDKHPEYAKSLNNVGVLYLEMGRLADAEELLIEAKDLLYSSIGENHPSYIRVLNSLGLLYQKMGEYNRAESYFISSIEKTNKNLSLNFSFLSEKEKEAYYKTHENKFDAFYTFSLIRQNSSEAITGLVYNNALRNKGLLLKSSTAMRTAILSSSDTTLISQYDKWIALKKVIANLYSQNISERQDDPQVLEEKANKMERLLVRESQTFSDFEQMQAVTWEKVRESLTLNEAAIEFIHFAQAENSDSLLYTALIVNPNSINPEMVPLFYEHELEAILGQLADNNLRYVNSVYGTTSNPNLQLYNLIWKPLEKYLLNAKTLYISPSGLLHKVSFAGLASEKDVFLCDKYSIHIQSSTGKVAINEVFSLQEGLSASVFGGINYNTDLTQDEVWNYLEGTNKEAQSISKILANKSVTTNVYTGNNSTEEALKQAATQSHLLHIATHGFFYPNPKLQKQQFAERIEEGDVVFRGGRGTRGFGVLGFVMNPNPLMRSGLTFAGANQVWTDHYVSGDKDGVLTAEEVVSVDMRRAALVVLSACETGLGEIKGSEGVYGLQRAFKMAGVKYIVMSLWQVPDSETVEFMETFYSKLLKYNSIRDSFAETQNEMRQKYDPYYWAAFVLVE